MESVKAWKDSNTLEKSSGEPSMKEYAIFSFNPEEVYDFLSWGGWNKGYESRYFIASDRFKNLEDAMDSLGYFNGLNEIQVIASIDGKGHVTPLVGRETFDPAADWTPYEKFASTNTWFN